MCKLQEPPVKQLKMSEPPVSGPDKMEKLEKRLTGEQQTNIKALNKKLFDERATPDFSHCWGLQEMSPKQLEFLESQKQKAKNKKAKKQKKTPTAGIEVVETLEEAPVKQINPEPALEQHAGFIYTPSEIDTMVETADQFSFPYERLKTEPTNHLMPGPFSKGQPEYLPTYEEMTFQDMLECGPSSMETQPDLEHTEVQVLDMPDLEQVALQEYLIDESKPLHTNFVLPNQGLASTCAVYFGRLENQQKVLDALCNEIYSKVLDQLGTMACRCVLVPILKPSQTPRNLNKVFLSCPQTRETRCGYVQWVHEPPTPNYVPKTATRSALKKRLNDMVQERMQERPKVEYEETIGGFMFP